MVIRDNSPDKTSSLDLKRHEARLLGPLSVKERVTYIGEQLLIKERARLVARVPVLDWDLGKAWLIAQESGYWLRDPQHSGKDFMEFALELCSLSFGGEVSRQTVMRRMDLARVFTREEVENYSRCGVCSTALSDIARADPVHRPALLDLAMRGASTDEIVEAIRATLEPRPRPKKPPNQGPKKPPNQRPKKRTQTGGPQPGQSEASGAETNARPAASGAAAAEPEAQALRRAAELDQREERVRAAEQQVREERARCAAWEEDLKRQQAAMEQERMAVLEWQAAMDQEQMALMEQQAVLERDRVDAKARRADIKRELAKLLQRLAVLEPREDRLERREAAFDLPDLSEEVETSVICIEKTCRQLVHLGRKLERQYQGPCEPLDRRGGEALNDARKAFCRARGGFIKVMDWLERDFATRYPEEAARAAADLDAWMDARKARRVARNAASCAAPANGAVSSAGPAAYMLDFAPP